MMSTQNWMSEGFAACWSTLRIAHKLSLRPQKGVTLKASFRGQMCTRLTKAKSSVQTLSQRSNQLVQLLDRRNDWEHLEEKYGLRFIIDHNPGRARGSSQTPGDVYRIHG